MTSHAVRLEPSDADPLPLEQIRIPVRAGQRRWTNKALAITDALDFWSGAGAAANVVMQLAWPEVGYGVVDSKVESGALVSHPYKRGRTTTQYLAVAILGNDEERAIFREAVNTSHRQVRSGPGDPVKYNAFDRDLQLWVAACLFIGFEDTYQLLHGRMDDQQREDFYRSSSKLGTTLQVTEDMWPVTRADFDEYWAQACTRVHIDDKVRAYLNDLLDLRMVGWYLRLPLRGLLRFLTIGFLAPVFREQMGVTWSDADQRRFDHLFVFVSFVNRYIPRFIRHGGSHALMADLRLRIRLNKRIV
ncbi:oxygenase MpaB family protein [Aldersonia kunmingensis]|uniref:oxygenase MpaB family protein n=1 Tax=Aldersonia kunmingensis TaxID=408066 RepID=UPI00082B3CC0|nr:oxygenase MpaB family protein [Aldersonia kunmingensis]